MAKVDLLTQQTKTYNFAVFDIETTGLNPKVNDIIQLGIVSLDKYTGLDSIYQTYIFSDQKIDADITAINGITSEMLVGAPDVNSVLNKVYRDYAGQVLVAHNCHGFDAKFFVAKTNYLFHDFYFLDTELMAKKLLPGMRRMASGSVSGFSQTTIAKLFGIEPVNAHRAQFDVSTLCQVFKKLLCLVPDQTSLTKFIKKGSEIMKSLEKGVNEIDGSD